jgi:hypothetical protein
MRDSHDVRENPGRFRAVTLQCLDRVLDGDVGRRSRNGPTRPSDTEPSDSGAGHLKRRTGEPGDCGVI